MFRLLGLMVVAFSFGLFASIPSTFARPMVLGVSWGGTLYDVDPVTGAATNPRSTGMNLVDIQFIGSTLYGLTWRGVPGDPNGNSLFRIDPITGAATLVGPTSLPADRGYIVEGDLAYDPVTGILYGSTFYGAADNPQSHFVFTIDPVSGAATLFGPDLGQTDFSGMAVDGAGRLFLTAGNFIEVTDTLLQIDKVTGAVVGGVALMPVNFCCGVGTGLGMDWDPITGQLFVVDAFNNNDGNAGLEGFYSLNTATGGLTYIGHTVSGGLVGIAFQAPEPTSLALLGLGLAGIGLSRRGKTH